jgi:hypothetical protein
MKCGFLVLRSHEVRDNVAALCAASAVAKPLVAYVALHHVFRLVQAAVAARVRRHFLGIGKEVVVLERLLEVQLNSFAGCKPWVSVGSCASCTNTEFVRAFTCYSVSVIELSRHGVSPVARLGSCALFEIEVHLAALARIAIKSKFALRRQAVVVTIALALRGISGATCL